MSQPEGANPVSIKVWVSDTSHGVALLWIADPRLGKDRLIRKDQPDAAHNASAGNIQEHAHVYRRVWGKGKGKKLKGQPGKWQETHVIKKDGTVSHSGRTKRKTGDPIPADVADVLRDHDYDIDPRNVMRFQFAGHLPQLIDYIVEQLDLPVEWVIVVVERLPSRKEG